MRLLNWWRELPGLVQAISLASLVGSTSFAAGAATTRTVDQAASLPLTIALHDSLITRNTAAIDTLRRLVPAVHVLQAQQDSTRAEVAAWIESNRLTSCYVLQMIEGKDPSGCARWVRDPSAIRPPLSR